MRSYIKFLVFVVAPVLILCANAWAAPDVVNDLKDCVKTEAQAKGNATISEFVKKLGSGDYQRGVDRLTGHWNYLIKDVHLRVEGSELKGKIGNSNWSTLTICSLKEKNDELQISILDRTGRTTIVRSKLSGTNLSFQQLLPRPPLGFDGFLTFKRVGEAAPYNIAAAPGSSAPIATGPHNAVN